MKVKQIIFFICFIASMQNYAMDITILKNKQGKSISFVRQEKISVNLSQTDIQDIEKDGLTIYVQNTTENSFKHINLTYKEFAQDDPQTELFYLAYLLIDSKCANNLVHLQETWPYCTDIINQLKKYGFVQTKPPEQKVHKRTNIQLPFLDSVTKYVMVGAIIVTGIVTFNLKYKKNK